MITKSAPAVVLEGSTVELTQDVPKHNLTKGQQGVVVGIRQPGILFQVEINFEIFDVSIRQCKAI